MRAIMLKRATDEVCDSLLVSAKKLQVELLEIQQVDASAQVSSIRSSRTL